MLRDDAERGAERADVEVNAADAHRGKFGGFLPRRFANARLKVIPPNGIADFGLLISVRFSKFRVTLSPCLLSSGIPAKW